ncbi:hypothetical protein PIB30_092168 [Stylosanthes scabra]|uniref:Uncharacterized protein n=1 Tax=Stylosanthes scabra TaxID=79078 RepID=A0ABU6RVF8_9FABA|nr:hypothetical protein [Stylosanthes scabra]
MRGEDVRAEDIIADKIVRMAQGIKEKGKLGFPSTIFKLCKEAEVPIREFRRTRKIQAEKPINAKEWSPQGYQDLSSEGSKKMKTWMSLCPRQRKEMKKEMKDKHMIMTTTTNPNSNITKSSMHHHIETQLQNMMWYQQQALENMSKNQAEYMLS